MSLTFTSESKLFLGSAALLALLCYGNLSDQRSAIERFSVYEDDTTESNRLLRQSGGTLDTHAMNALHVIEKKKLQDRTLADHLNAANLRHLYRDEGFVDGSFHSYDAMPHYIQALAKARSQERVLPTSDLLGVTETARSYLAKIRAVEPYRIRHTNGNPQLNRAILAQQVELDNQIQKTQTTLQQQALAQANNTSNNRAETADKYLENSKGWNVDRQNVHDSHVQNTLRETVQTLGQLDAEIIAPPDEQDPWSAAKTYIETNPQKFTDAKRNNALFALNTIRGSHGVHSGMDYPENKIFEMTWRRVYHPKNQMGEHASNIKDMIVENLADCTVDFGQNNKGTVCASGRIGRTLSSLTMTDADTALGGGGAMTIDAIRNETFEYAQKAIKHQLDIYKASETPEHVALVSSYEQPASSMIVSPQIEQQFKSDVMQKISDHIDHQYGSKLAPANKQTLLNHVEAGI